MTARALFNAFQRWGEQVQDPTRDFDELEFLRRWLKLTGAAPITREILTFLRNEVHLAALAKDTERPWAAARRWTSIAERVMSQAIRDGIPAHEGATRWRLAEAQERNAEETLLAALDAIGRVAYPLTLMRSAIEHGGWSAGPIVIPEFNTRDGFGQFLQRLVGQPNGWIGGITHFAAIPKSPVLSMLSRLSLKGVVMIGKSFHQADFTGADFENAQLDGCVVSYSNFSGASLREADLNFAFFERVELGGVDLTDANLSETFFDDVTIKSASPCRGPGYARRPVRASFCILHGTPRCPCVDVLAGCVHSMEWRLRGGKDNGEASSGESGQVTQGGEDSDSQTSGSQG